MSQFVPTCPACAAPVPPANVELAVLAAKCDACGTVFSLERELQPETALPADTPVRERSADGRVVLEYRWFSAGVLFLLLFAAVWDGFLVNWYGLALRADVLQPLLVLFPLGHVAVGVWVTYTAVAGLVNRTTVTLGDGRIAVRHGPLPWWGNRDHPLTEVRSLFVTEREQRNRRGRRSQTVYDVEALGPDGTSTVLLSSVENGRIARYLERRIAAYVGQAGKPGR